jgi:hypothetical protein
MNLQAIAEQYLQFRRRELTLKWDAPLEQVLEVLFKDYVEKDYSCDFADMLPKERVALYTLFDLAFMSDEQCELHVLEVDGKPLGIAYKFADKSDWDCHIIDAGLFKVVARELAIAALDKRLEAVTLQPLERLADLRNGYIHFLDEAETMFAVRSPNYMYGFDRLTESHRAFYVDGEGAAHPVALIGKFVSKRTGNGTDNHDVTITLASGADVVVDGSELMFELIADKGDVAAALTAYTDPSVWCVGDVFENVMRIIVYQHVQFRWSTRSLWVTFESMGELQRFVATHHREEPELIQAGLFDLTALGFAGNVIEH